MTRRRSESALKKERAVRELVAARRVNLADLKALPRIKLARKRDDARWDMIRCLLRYQKIAKPVRDVADYDLMKCALGKYPSPLGNAGKYSKAARSNSKTFSRS